MSLFTEAIAIIPSVKDAEGRFITDNWLQLCRLVLPVIDQFGTAFMIVKNDISGNIERLAARKATDPERFHILYSMVEDELARNDYNHSKSCTKGLLWLKRAMEFMVAIMKGVIDRPEETLNTVVQENYYATLHQWHGFLASSAFHVAIHFVPSREDFLAKCAGNTGESALAEMGEFIKNFSPLLTEIHKWLDQHGLDDPPKV